MATYLYQIFIQMHIYYTYYLDCLSLGFYFLKAVVYRNIMSL